MDVRGQGAQGYPQSVTHLNMPRKHDIVWSEAMMGQLLAWLWQANQNLGKWAQSVSWEAEMIITGSQRHFVPLLTIGRLVWAA